jgi:hypothetical protein
MSRAVVVLCLVAALAVASAAASVALPPKAAALLGCVDNADCPQRNSEYCYCQHTTFGEGRCKCTTPPPAKQTVTETTCGNDRSCHDPSCKVATWTAGVCSQHDAARDASVKWRCVKGGTVELDTYRGPYCVGAANATRFVPSECALNARGNYMNVQCSSY